MVDGGAAAPFDLPAVRAFIRIFAPRRGEIVVDAESLDLRPPKSKTPDPDRPKAPRRRHPPPRHAATGRRATAEAADAGTPGRRGRRGRDRRAMTLEIDVLTLFPAMFDGPLGDSIPGRIQERAWPRSGSATCGWGLGRHRSVDDAPYGGGAGMVLRPEPVAAALDELRRPDSVGS